MKSKSVLKIVSIILIVLGVGICFATAILSNQDVEVRIERAGVCNPLKPVKDKEVTTDKKTKKELAKYWKKTDKDDAPKDSDIVDSLVGDYKLFVGEDEILFNLDLSYVSYNGKYVDISDEFIEYLSDYVRENDKNLEEIKEPEKNPGKGDSGDCCSCCPDLKPGESCIALCCPCN